MIKLAETTTYAEQAQQQLDGADAQTERASVQAQHRAAAAVSEMNAAAARCTKIAPALAQARSAASPRSKPFRRQRK